MLEKVLIENIYFTLLLWGLAYLSDYILTIYGASLYQRYGREHIIFEGSYELNPFFEKDVNALRRISPRFISAWVISLGVILFAWATSVNLLNNWAMFSFLIGALLLLEAAVHIRHLRNIALFRWLKTPGRIQGRVEYSRWLSLRLSTVELLGFASLYAFGWLVSGSHFFVGGAFACGVFALRQGLQAIRVKPMSL